MTEETDALWDEVWDDSFVAPCFACGDDVIVDIYLDTQAVLCDMCSIEWERSIVDFVRTDSLAF